MLGFETITECAATHDEILRYLASPIDDPGLRAPFIRRRRWLAWRGWYITPLSRWSDA